MAPSEQLESWVWGLSVRTGTRESKSQRSNKHSDCWVRGIEEIAQRQDAEKWEVESGETESSGELEEMQKGAGHLRSSAGRQLMLRWRQLTSVYRTQESIKMGWAGPW